MSLTWLLGFPSKKNVFVCVCFACAFQKFVPTSPGFLDSIRDLNSVGEKGSPGYNSVHACQFLQGNLKLPATENKKNGVVFWWTFPKRMGFPQINH